MKNQVLCCYFLWSFFAINGFYCVPIFTEEENLKSIVISEIDLPTEQSILTENVNTVNPGKPDTFVELYEKYDELFNKNVTVKKLNESEKVQKRSSNDDDENESEVEKTQSIIEKSQTISDPEVRKEFELDLNNYGQVTEDESVKPQEQDVGTEYDPNYARKIINVPEKENEIANVFTTERSVQDLMVEEEGRMLIDEPTTIEPQDISIDFNRRKNLEIVEVFEHIFFHPSNVDTFEEATSSTLNIEVDFEPIQVIGEDRDAFRTELTTVESFVEGEKTVEPEDKNDFVVIRDEDANKVLTKTDEESEKTEEKAEEITAENVQDPSSYFTRSIDKTPETIVTSSKNIETVTEIIEVHTEVSVSIEINKTDKATGKPLLINEIVKHSSSSEKSDKSSEESDSSKSSEKEEKKKEKQKDDKTSSESSEENNAREILDTDEFRTDNLENKDDRMKLADELFKDTLEHDIKKKDHPVVPLAEVVGRKFTEEADIADHLDDKVKPTETRTFEDTTVTLYEAFEEVVTTLSDGLKLSNELRTTLDSFREPIDENKTVLDTNNEAISSKNIKNSLVNIAEEMTLENHTETAEASYLMVSVIGVISVAIVVSLFVVVKKKSSRVVFFQAPSEF